MRERLARGKRVDNGEWVEGNVVIGAKGEPYIVQISDVPFDNFEFIPVTPESVGDYTGLKDKNGKRIFEWDILKVKTYWKKGKGYKEFAVYENGYISDEKGETYWTVKWLNHSTESNGWYCYGIDRRWHKPLTFSRTFNSNAEIVGNIHDNPELLEVRE